MFRFFRNYYRKDTWKSNPFTFTFWTPLSKRSSLKLTSVSLGRSNIDKIVVSCGSFFPTNYFSTNKGKEFSKLRHHGVSSVESRTFGNPSLSNVQFWRYLCLVEENTIRPSPTFYLFSIKRYRQELLSLESRMIFQEAIGQGFRHGLLVGGDAGPFFTHRPVSPLILGYPQILFSHRI